jgi:hypothetical protein
MNKQRNLRLLSPMPWVHSKTLGAALVVVLWSTVQTLHATPIYFYHENLGNFPDAIAVTAEFDTFVNRDVNGIMISATGFLFHLTNTSYGDGLHSSFAYDPDGDFAENDVLTPEAGLALNERQPFGIYFFGALLPTGSGAVRSAPDGFDERDDPGDPNMEVNFSIELEKSLDGLIFDAAAAAAPLSIPSAFTHPRTGTYDFFISVPVNPVTGKTYTIEEILNLQDPLSSNADQGIDISTRMAWDPITGDDELGSTRDPEIPNLGQLRLGQLRPRGQVGPVNAPAIPEPSSLLLVGVGLVGLGSLVGRRRYSV